MVYGAMLAKVCSRSHGQPSARAQPRHDREQFAHPASAHGATGRAACNMRRKVISMPAVAPQILRSP